MMSRFKPRQEVDDQPAVEMIDLMLDGGRQQSLRLEFLRRAVAVDEAHQQRSPAARSRPSRRGSTGSLPRRRADRHPARTISGLISTSGCCSSSSPAVSSTTRRREWPIWGAARPIPGAAYIVSSMSSASRRSSSSTRSIGAAVFRRMGSGSVMIGSFAMAAHSSGHPACSMSATSASVKPVRIARTRGDRPEVAPQPFIFGSSQSRRLSPSRLKANTASVMARPGNRIIHGAAL